MRIKKVSATNFKNLNLNGTPFRSVTLVLGENGVGKSNLILLLHTFFKKKESLKELPPQQFAIEGFVEQKDLIRRGERQGKAEVTVTCFSDAFEDLRKAFFAKSRQGKSDDVTIEFVYRSYSGGLDVRIPAMRLGRQAIYPIPGKPGDRGLAEKQKVLEEWVNADLVDATTYIPNSRLLKRGLVDFRIDGPFDAASDLENTLLKLLTNHDTDPDIFDRIKETLDRFFRIKDIRPNLERMIESSRGSESEAAKTTGQSGVGVGVRIKEDTNRWFDLAQVGTGVQQILVMMTMIQGGLEGKPARIALIEEFESSLSIKTRKQFLQQLIEVVGPGKPLRQVIMTSHAIFRPKAQEVHSIGPDNPKARTSVNFRQWEPEDWARHSSG